MQLGKWDVEVNGQDYGVTVERTENGKDMVRINGRVAAKPIGAEEQTRSITIGGWPYTLKRINPNAYDLEVDEMPVEMARKKTMETGNAILAHSDAPVAMKRSSFFSYLPNFGYILLVLGVVGLMYMLKGQSYDKVAFDRVNKVFSEMHDMKGSPEAVTFWFKNKKILDTQALSQASDGFTKWSMEKGMYRKIGDFHVIDSTEIKGEAVPTAIVRIVVEGNEYKLKVPKDLPMEWME